MPGVVKLAIGGIAAIFLLIAFLTSYTTVDQYERVVVTRFGEVTKVAEPGLLLTMPFVNSTHSFRVDIQNLQNDKPANTYTVDNQEIDVIFNVFYRLPPENVSYIYANVPDFRERLYILALDRLKAEMGKVNVAHVAERRGELRDVIKAVLVRDAKHLRIEVTDFQLTNLEYTKSFRVAVEAAAAQKAGIETREYEQQQMKKTAETARIQAEGAANAAREQARGQADARVLVATAEAKAIELQGVATAAAIKAQADALRANSELVELRKAEKWNGALPTQMLSGVVPFMQFQAPAGR